MEKCSAETLAGTRCKKYARTEGKCKQHHEIATRVVVLCAHRWRLDPDQRCKNKAKYGLFCGTHKELTPEQKCTHIQGEVQCHRKKQINKTLCSTHHRAEQERLFRIFRQDNRHIFTHIYMNRAQQNNIDPFGGDQRYAIRMMDCVFRCLHFKFHRLPTDTRTDDEIVDMFPVLLPINTPPPPDTRTELQRLATDTQNVHTAPVSQQTNRGIAELMKVIVPPKQNTLYELRTIWTAIYTGRAVDERIYEDMALWYSQPTCCKENDWLYKTLLDRLVVKIKSFSDAAIKKQLFMRLQQECADSYHMCCIGHINRIINVMIGFDEAFQPSIPKGEILQNKFAMFSQMEDDTEKYLQATALLAELNVVGDEAAVWLDALAV
jgi:hypothetical protein